MWLFYQNIFFRLKWSPFHWKSGTESWFQIHIQVYVLEHFKNVVWWMKNFLSRKYALSGTNANTVLHQDSMPIKYSKTCVREPPSRLTLNSSWCGKSCLSYKGTCHVILLAKLHDMYLYKTTTFPYQPLRSISKVAVLHRCLRATFKTDFSGWCGKVAAL